MFLYLRIFRFFYFGTVFVLYSANRFKETSINLLIGGQKYENKEMALAVLMICGSASARDFRRGECKCKKCKMEQRFQHDKQVRGKKAVHFREVRFNDPRFRDARFRDPKLREQVFRERRMEKARLEKKQARKHRHHRR